MEEAKGLQCTYQISIVLHEGASRVTHVRKVMAAITATLAHFIFSGQFMGFLGSSGPSQSTMFVSTSCLFASGSCLSESSLPWPASISISLSKLELAGVPFSFRAGIVEEDTFSGSVLRGIL